MFRLSLASLFLIAALAAACSSSAQESNPTSDFFRAEESAASAASGDDAAPRLLASAATYTQTQSYRFRWSMHMAGVPDLPDGFEVGGEGAVDAGAQLVEMEIDFSALFGALGDLPNASRTDTALIEALLGDEPVRFVMAGDTVYVRWQLLTGLLGAETDWVAFEDAGAAAPAELTGLGGISSPDQLLAAFEDLLELREAGPDTLDGVPVTRYDGVLDLAAAAASLDTDAFSPQALPQLPAGFEQLPLSVWVDDQNRVRRFLASFSGSIEGQDVSFDLGFDLFGFGQPLVVQLPPADQVTFLDGSSLLSGFAGFGDFSTSSSLTPPTAPLLSPAASVDLDALWASCDAGDMASCDELFFRAPLNSDYEHFGDTCGDRVPANSGLLCSQRS